MNPWLAAAATAVVVSERGRHALGRAVRLGVAVPTAAVGAIASGVTAAAHAGGRVAGELVDEAKQMRASGVEAAVAVPTAAEPVPPRSANRTTRPARRPRRPSSSAKATE